MPTTGVQYGTTMLSRAILFLAVFAPSVLLLNTELRLPESEARPLVIAGDAIPLAGEAAGLARP